MSQYADLIERLRHKHCCNSNMARGSTEGCNCDEAADAIASLEAESREAERRGEQRAIARIVNAARAIGWQAGVGGRETAGAIVSYLATSPDEIAPFVAGELSPIDFAGDWVRGGCLTWHAVNGKVVSPEETRAALHPGEKGNG